MQPPQPPAPPLYDPSELHGIVGADVKQAFDMRDVIARVVDGSDFREFKKEYGPTVVTASLLVIYCVSLFELMTILSGFCSYSWLSSWNHCQQRNLVLPFGVESHPFH